FLPNFFLSLARVFGSLAFRSTSSRIFFPFGERANFAILLPSLHISFLLRAVTRGERGSAADRRRSRPARARCRPTGRAPSPRATPPGAAARSARAACEEVSESGPAAPARPPHRRCRAGPGAPSRPRTRGATTDAAAQNRGGPRPPRPPR